MSLLGIEVSSDFDEGWTSRVRIEGAESIDALGQVICQESLSLIVDEDLKLDLSVCLAEDEIEPIFSGAAWAGTVLWRAAVRLIDVALLSKIVELDSTKSVIELGCGLGVPGMVAKAIGAGTVVLTEQQNLVDLLKRNVKANNLEIECRELDWENRQGQTAQRYDVVLCCDCVYQPLYGDSYVYLAETIDEIAQSDVFISVERRFVRDGTDGVDEFLALLDKAGFQATFLKPALPPIDIIHFRRR